MKNKSTQVLYHRGGLDLFGVSRKPKGFFLQKSRSSRGATRVPFFPWDAESS